MNIDYKAAGKMMGSYRRKEKISQKELAKAVGISNNYLSNIENGYTVPSLETFTELSVTLAILLIFLLSRALGYFFGNITNYNALYGSIGVILAVQLWLYFNMLVLLIGYELNTSIAKARTDHSRKLKLRQA